MKLVARRKYSSDRKRKRRCIRVDSKTSELYSPQKSSQKSSFPPRQTADLKASTRPTLVDKSINCSIEAISKGKSSYAPSTFEKKGEPKREEGGERFFRQVNEDAPVTPSRVSFNNVAQQSRPPTISTPVRKLDSSAMFWIDKALHMLGDIWKDESISLVFAAMMSNPKCSSGQTVNTANLAPLGVFVEEILARSRTTGAVLCVALHYIEVLRPKLVNVSACVTPSSFLETCSTDAFSNVLPSPLLCPRRVFLAALVLATKFVEDVCLPNSEWARLAGLPASEVARCERAVGDALDWRLWILSSSVVQSRLQE